MREFFNADSWVWLVLYLLLYAYLAAVWVHVCRLSRDMRSVRFLTCLCLWGQGILSWPSLVIVAVFAALYNVTSGNIIELSVRSARKKSTEDAST